MANGSWESTVLVLLPFLCSPVPALSSIRAYFLFLCSDGCSGAENRASDYQLGEPGFESHTVVSNLGHVH